jgi:SAM-dependent methyltransferase
MISSMQKHCNICESPLQSPVYDSRSSNSLTSLCQLYKGATQVWFCENCGHILSNPLAETEQYYASDYKILLNHEDEDQIYEVINGELIYRTDHQINVLKQKLVLTDGKKILDYGCAKATMAKKLLEQLANTDFYFFDVSDMYRNYWEQLTSPDKCAVNKTPSEWTHSFDVITSYFSLEHIPAIKQAVEHIASLLKNDGVFYAIVPDTFGNVADFVVVDHVNHFTSHSIIHLLQAAGFSEIDVDDQSHRGALVIVARKRGDLSATGSKAELGTKVNNLVNFWNGFITRIEQAESSHGNSCAIYGSGFYGAFIYSHLKNPSAVKVFLDQSPYQQGRELFGVAIIAPADLPNDINTLYVGLNPSVAAQVISSQACFNRDNLAIIFPGECA